MEKITDRDYFEIESQAEVLKGNLDDFIQLVDDVSAKIEQVIKETTIGSAGLTTLKDLFHCIIDYRDSLVALLEVQQGEIESYADSRSEKWQESDKANAYQAWLESIATYKSLIENLHAELELNLDLESGSCDLTYDSECQIKRSVIMSNANVVKQPRTELKYRTSDWGEVKVNVYGGQDCDKHEPFIEMLIDGEIESSGALEEIAIEARQFPAGTKILIEVPCCPDCHLDARFKDKESKCECGFDWLGWTNERYS